MPLFPPAPLDLPAPPEPERSLVRSSRTLAWPSGRPSAIAVAPNCPTGRVAVFDACELPDASDPLSREAPRFWQPFVAQASDACTTNAWQQGGPQRAQDYLRADRSRQLAHEFWTGEVAETTDWDGVDTNLWLAKDGSVEVLSETPVKGLAALIALETALAPCGGRGMIHTPPSVATYWQHLGVLSTRGADLVTTVMGTVVVVDAGYPGTEPGGTGSGVTDEMWVYGTGTVYRFEEPPTVTPGPGDAQGWAAAVHRETNTVEWRAEQLSVLLWDGCCHFGIPVDLSIEELPV